MAIAQIEIVDIGFQTRGGTFEKFVPNFARGPDRRHRVMTVKLIGVNTGGHDVRMTRGVESRDDSDLPHIDAELVGDDLRERRGVTLARVETASKNRGAAVGFQSDARGFALTAEQLGRRSEEHTSELQSRENLVCRLLLEKKKKK